MTGIGLCLNMLGKFVLTVIDLAETAPATRVGRQSLRTRITIRLENNGTLATVLHVTATAVVRQTIPQGHPFTH